VLTIQPKQTEFSFMFADLRVPVERTNVEVLTTDGKRHELVVFHPPGVGIDSFVEASEPFFPAHEGAAFLMFSRANVMALSIPAPAEVSEADEALPKTRRNVRVHLLGNTTMTGEIRYVAWEGASRPVDYLNEPTLSFALFREGRVFHVSKRHVSYVEELR
jgi:hypothetical protein